MKSASSATVRRARSWHTGVASEIRRLPAGVDIQHGHLLRGAQRRDEVIEQGAGAGQGVRLEHQDQAAARVALPQPVDEAGDSHRMVSVIIDHGGLWRAQPHIEPAPRPGKAAQRRGDGRTGQPICRAARYAAVAFRTLCRPGSVTRSATSPPGPPVTENLLPASAASATLTRTALDARTRKW
jgi:hypothetical protein